MDIGDVAASLPLLALVAVVLFKILKDKAVELRDRTKSLSDALASGPGQQGRHSSVDVRLAYVAQLSGDSDHMADLKPLLQALASDADLRVREMAARRLQRAPRKVVDFEGRVSRPGAQDAIPGLEAALRRGRNDSIKDDIQRALDVWRE